MHSHEEQEPTESSQGGIDAGAEEVGQQVVELRPREVSGDAPRVDPAPHFLVESGEEAIRLLVLRPMLVDDTLIQSVRPQLAVHQQLHHFAVPR